MKKWTTACGLGLGMLLTVYIAAPASSATPSEKNAREAMLMCSPPTALNVFNITTNTAELSWTSAQSPIDNNCWTITIGGQGLGNCNNSGQALQQFTICAGDPGVTVAGSIVSYVAQNLPPGTPLEFYVAETCSGITPPGNVSPCAGPQAFQTFDDPFTVTYIAQAPSCPFISPGYIANGAFTVVVTNGTTCINAIYTVTAMPVAGSGPGGSTPPPTTISSFVGLPAGNFLFNNAGPGTYQVTVTETGPCNPAVNPVVINVVVPDGMDVTLPTFYLTDILGNILADNDPLTAQGTNANLGTITLPEGVCGRQDEYYVYGTDNCDGFITANNAVTAVAVTMPATINPSTQTAVTPDGFGFYLVDIHWSIGNSTVTVTGHDASANAVNLTITANFPDNEDPIVSILANSHYTIPVCQTTVTAIVTVQIDDGCDQSFLPNNLTPNFNGLPFVVNFTGNNYREYIVTLSPGQFNLSAGYTDAAGNTGTISQNINVVQAAQNQPPVITANAETVTMPACVQQVNVVYSFTIEDDCEPININDVTFNGNGANLTLFFTDAAGPNTVYFEFAGNVPPGTYFPVITYQGINANPTLEVIQTVNQPAQILLPGNLTYLIPVCMNTLQTAIGFQIADDCDQPIQLGNLAVTLGGAPISIELANPNTGYFEIVPELSTANDGDLLTITYTDAGGLTTTTNALLTVNAQPDQWAPIIVYPAQDIEITLDPCAPPVASFFFEVTVTDNCDGNLAPQIIATPSAGISLVPSQSPGGTTFLTLAEPGTYHIEINATDAAGNTRNEDFTIKVNQAPMPVANLGCADTTNVVLNNNCQALIIPEMVLEGNFGCLSANDFQVLVEDGDPSNGPLLDGCGVFPVQVSLATPQPVNGFQGPFAPSNWSTTVNGGGFVSFAAGGTTLTLNSGSLANFSQPGFAGAIIVIPTAGQLNFDWTFDGNDPGYDFFGFLLDAAGNPVLNFSTTQAGNGHVNAAVQAGYTLAIFINSPFDQFIASQAVIADFVFTPAANPAAGDFTTCWGVIESKDLTPPTLPCPDDTDQAIVLQEVQRISGELTTSDPTLVLTNYSCLLDFINPSPGNHYYDIYTFTVNQADIYTFDLATTWGGGWAALFQGSFNPAMPCENIIAQGDYVFDGTLTDFFPFDPIVRVSLPLIPGQTYTLVTSASGTQGTGLTGAYTWAFYSDAGGLLSGPTPEQLTVAHDLLCSDLQHIALDSLPANVPRCYSLTKNGQVIYPVNQTERQRLQKLLDRLALTGYPGQPGGPQAGDNCGSVQVCVSDQIHFNGDCGTIDITRTFKGIDEKGNMTTCQQVITIRQPNMTDVLMPPYTAFLECDEGFATDGNGNPHPSVTGYPFLLSAFGFHDLAQSYCTIAASYLDGTRVSICPSSYKFLREWTVINWCNPGSSAIYSQLIKVGDYTPPVVTCPIVANDWDGLSDSIIYSTGPFGCSAAFMAPLPEVTDNCSDWEVLTEIVTDAGGDVFVLASIPHNAPSRAVGGIPEGCHRFRYTVTDACGNSTVFECPFCVEDHTHPIAICNDDLQVSIGGQGNARVFASDVDEGSWDNCDIAALQVRRQYTEDSSCGPIAPYFSPWGNFIDFTCCDVGDSVRIELRITDLVGQTDVCWFKLRVQDKIKPQCIAPHQTSVACDALPYNFNPQDTAQLQALFGVASAIDNCAGASAQELTPIVDLHECGYGLVIRRFRAIDNAGNISSSDCQQVVTILPAFNYEIRFPADTSAICGTPPADSVHLYELACDLLAVSVSDEFLSTSGDECYKIFRTYRVIDWCEYDGQSPPVIIGRDEDCDGIPGDEPVWVLRRQTGAFVDRDSIENNNIPAAGTKGTACDGTTNPQGYWRTTPSNGYWQYTQLLKVYDHTPPQVYFTEPDPYCSFDPTGCDTEVEYVFLVFETCTPNDISFQIFYDENADGILDLDLTNFNVISGQYPKFKVTWEVPIGMHAFQIFVSDGCGNSTDATMPFEVVDCKEPGPICINGLSVDLMPVPPNTDADGDGDFDTGAITLSVNDFIASPVTDCSMPVRYSIHRLNQVPAPGQVSLVLTCDDRPNLIVRIYAWDSADNPYAVQPDGTLGGPNYSYCETYVLVQDNVFHACGTGPIAEISGIITTEEDEPVQGVHVQLSGADSQSQTTLVDGTYRFTALENGYDYTITPQLDIDPLNGVSTFDLLLITKHILGVLPLDSPYKRIAADVNRSGTITTYDLIQLRRLILYIDTDFANNTSWRFVPAAYQFLNPQHPWQEVFPELININDLSGNHFTEDFIAIKTGDVNLSAAVNFQALEERHTGPAFEVLTNNKELTPGNETEIWFNAPAADAIDGFQFTLQWDPEVLDSPELLDGRLSSANFGRQWLDKGILTVSWNKEGETPQTDSPMPLFGLKFRAMRTGDLNGQLRITSLYTKAEAYAKNGTPTDIVLHFEGATTSVTAEDIPVLLQNEPNPFHQNTQIAYYLPEDTWATLALYDAQGRILHVLVQGKQEHGWHKVNVDERKIPEKGVVFYGLDTQHGFIWRRMVKL